MLFILRDTAVVPFMGKQHLDELVEKLHIICSPNYLMEFWTFRIDYS